MSETPTSTRATAVEPADRRAFSAKPKRV